MRRAAHYPFPSARNAIAARYQIPHLEPEDKDLAPVYADVDAKDCAVKSTGHVHYPPI